MSCCFALVGGDDGTVLYAAVFDLRDSLVQSTLPIRSRSCHDPRVRCSFVTLCFITALASQSGAGCSQAASEQPRPQPSPDPPSAVAEPSPPAEVAHDRSSVTIIFEGVKHIITHGGTPHYTFYLLQNTGHEAVRYRVASVTSLGNEHPKMKVGSVSVGQWAGLQDFAPEGTVLNTVEPAAWQTLPRRPAFGCPPSSSRVRPGERPGISKPN
jgi:hypothetical protein